MENRDLLIDRLETAMFTTMRRLGNEMTQLSDFGITGPQFYILNILHRRGECNATQLAEILQVKPSAITVMIDRLVQNHFVDRKQDEQDRRSVIMKLTDHGRDVLQQANGLRKRALKHYLSFLESEELSAFVDTFDKLVDILKDSDKSFSGNNHTKN